MPLDHVHQKDGAGVPEVGLAKGGIGVLVAGPVKDDPITAGQDPVIAGDDWANVCSEEVDTNLFPSGLQYIIYCTCLTEFRAFSVNVCWLKSLSYYDVVYPHMWSKFGSIVIAGRVKSNGNAVE